MLLDLREKDKLIAVVALDLEDLDELFQNVGARPDSQWPGALEWTLLLPSGDALLTEELPAIVTFHGVNWNFKADATDERILQLLVHFSIFNSLDVVASLIHLLVGTVTVMGHLLRLRGIIWLFGPSTFALFGFLSALRLVSPSTISASVVEHTKVIGAR